LFHSSGLSYALLLSRGSESECYCVNLTGDQHSVHWKTNGQSRWEAPIVAKN
jgi:hypothetical protein